MGGYEERRAEYECARNSAMEEWFAARQLVARTGHTEFIFEGGFRMAWEKLHTDTASAASGEEG